MNFQELLLETWQSSSLSSSGDTNLNQDNENMNLDSNLYSNLLSSDDYLHCRLICRTCQDKEEPRRIVHLYRQKRHPKTNSTSVISSSTNILDKISIHDVLLRNGMDCQASPKSLLLSLRQLLDHFSDQPTPDQLKPISYVEHSNDDESLEEEQGT
jgi:hypothetical protein